MWKYSWASTWIKQKVRIDLYEKIEKSNLKRETINGIKAIIRLWYRNKKAINIKVIKTNQTCFITNKDLTIRNLITSNIQKPFKWLKKNFIINSRIDSSR